MFDEFTKEGIRQTHIAHKPGVVRILRSLVFELLLVIGKVGGVI